MNLSEALEHLVKGIVDHPDQVRIDARGGNRGETLEIRVHPEDLGRVIGRSGRTAQALRAVISALASGERVRVDVVDTDAPEAR
ncbi:MAG: RNA-binding protein [Leucobacter sp.]